MNKFFGHLHTINTHRRLVRKACFKMGIYWQGLTHDLSKYSPTEFWPGVKYFDGTHSPTQDERIDIGYSAAWLHHQGRNRHHFEYWQDYSPEHRGKKMPVPMPMKYVAEMVADRYAACKVYHKDTYTQHDALDYFLRSKDRIQMHEDTKALLGEILEVMANEGEDAAFAYTKQLLHKAK